MGGRSAVVLRMLGMLTMLFSLAMLPPFVVAEWYGDGERQTFAYAFLLVLAAGLVCWLPVRNEKAELHNDDAFLVVIAFWLAVSALGAVPFALSLHPHMHLADSVFESVSGLTTTGATVLSGLDDLPHAIRFYRAELNFLGGMGIVVLAVALLPMLGIGGMQLYVAETPGPMKQEKLTPRITETAKRLWYVYVALTGACAVAFWIAGMDWFDAVAHSFATLSLGGFSTHDQSIGYFHSAGVEMVGGIFTILAGVNFALHFVAWRSLNMRAYLNDPEFRLYIKILGLIILTTCGYLYLSGTFALWPSIYHGVFQASSITADNGLVTTGYPGSWPLFPTLLLAMASFFGGSAGSTCGGIKAVRFLLLYRQSVREIKLLLHPRAYFTVKLGSTTVPEKVITAVWGFFFLYIFTYCVLSLALVALGADIVTALGSVAGCLNNMGVGLGGTAAGFGLLSVPEKWVLSTAMLLGRLEIFPFLMLFVPEFWTR